ANLDPVVQTLTLRMTVHAQSSRAALDPQPVPEGGFRPKLPWHLLDGGIQDAVKDLHAAETGPEGPAWHHLVMTVIRDSTRIQAEFIADPDDAAVWGDLLPDTRSGGRPEDTGAADGATDRPAVGLVRRSLPSPADLLTTARVDAV